MIGIGCCARTMSGHTDAAPPISVMNSRRLISNTGLPPPPWALGASNDHQPADGLCTTSLPRREVGILGQT
jgi:hypothetical protein